MSSFIYCGVWTLPERKLQDSISSEVYSHFPTNWRYALFCINVPVEIMVFYRKLFINVFNFNLIFIEFVICTLDFKKIMH